MIYELLVSTVGPQAGELGYTRSKTGVGVEMGVRSELQKALAVAPRDHVTIISTEFEQPFTVGGFSQFMRVAITAAGLPLDCKPHTRGTGMPKQLPEVWEKRR